MALDVGNVEAVYGPDEESNAELNPEADWRTRARIWLWQRHHGYLPIQDREAELRRALEKMGAAGRACSHRGS